ncbi:hypothetical protein T265_04771 [Opisthorchis viverrini]|uniref:Uncharacterized protein n=2 Tax=Opisthorchis viverrini TaxID=6198 RepID=A0A074ZLY9_OPIVI|nr:hypothetical protein T265_04771 [Opisthorchis viverrini]KER28388.1 hypothetical protein T265_04771 [Opisthorchis viverrini]
MQARLIVAILVIVGAVFGAVHIALSLYSAVDKNWVQFTVPSDLYDEKVMETQNRRRGLLVECVDGKDYCHYLEGLADQGTYPHSSDILRLRSTAPALAYSSIILAALAYTLGGIAFAIFRNKPRRRQILLLFFGVFAWIAGPPEKNGGTNEYRLQGRRSQRSYWAHWQFLHDGRKCMGLTVYDQ